VGVQKIFGFFVSLSLFHSSISSFCVVPFAQKTSSFPNLVLFCEKRTKDQQKTTRSSVLLLLKKEKDTQVIVKLTEKQEK
jgi:hypothetical protein